MTSNQVQVSQIFSEFTQYENEDIQEIYTTLDDYRKVRPVYSPDNYYPPSEIQKYTYHLSHSYQKVIKINFRSSKKFVIFFVVLVVFHIN